MGLDLTLFPHYWGDQPMNDGIFPHVKLSLPGGARDMEDLMAAEGVQAHPLPPGVRFWYYHDEGLKEETTDCYGQPLTYVLAGELAAVKHGRTRWEPAWAYLRALPPRTPVVLWWH